MLSQGGTGCPTQSPATWLLLGVRPPAWQALDQGQGRLAGLLPPAGPASALVIVLRRLSASRHLLCVGFERPLRAILVSDAALALPVGRCLLSSHRPGGWERLPSGLIKGRLVGFLPRATELGKLFTRWHYISVVTRRNDPIPHMAEPGTIHMQAGPSLSLLSLPGGQVTGVAEEEVCVSRAGWVFREMGSVLSS